LDGSGGDSFFGATRLVASAAGGVTAGGLAFAPFAGLAAVLGAAAAGFAGACTGGAAALGLASAALGDAGGPSASKSLTKSKSCTSGFCATLAARCTPE
jgi:hypothetical protein